LSEATSSDELLAVRRPGSAPCVRGTSVPALGLAAEAGGAARMPSLDDAAALRRAWTAADWVVHAAGLIRARNAPNSTSPTWRRTGRGPPGPPRRARRPFGVSRLRLEPGGAGPQPGPDSVSPYAGRRTAAPSRIHVRRDEAPGEERGCARAGGGWRRVMPTRRAVSSRPRDNGDPSQVGSPWRSATCSCASRRPAAFSMVPRRGLGFGASCSRSPACARLRGEIFFAAEPDRADYGELGGLGAG